MINVARIKKPDELIEEAVRNLEKLKVPIVKLPPPPKVETIVKEFDTAIRIPIDVIREKLKKR